MRLTTKGRYAVTAMLDLALHAQHGPVSLADISERQGISLSYLEQLFAKLRRGNLVSSVRGPGGGYQLSREKATIQVAQVIDAVNESVDATRCQGLGDCHGGDTCLTHHLWCANNAYSVADVAVVCFLNWLDFRLPEIDWRNSFPNLTKLSDYLNAQAAYSETLPRLA